MDDLISRAAAIAEIEEYIEEYSDLDENGYHNLKWCAMEEARDVLSMLPAVDAVPVVHARWITYPECLGYDGAYHDEHIVCSACHSVWNIIDNDTERFDHCPACGANMDGEQKEANDGNSNNP